MSWTDCQSLPQLYYPTNIKEKNQDDSLYRKSIQLLSQDDLAQKLFACMCDKSYPIEPIAIQMDLCKQECMKDLLSNEIELHRLVFHISPQI